MTANNKLERSVNQVWPHRARNRLRARRCGEASWAAAQQDRYASRGANKSKSWVVPAAVAALEGRPFGKRLVTSSIPKGPLKHLAALSKNAEPVGAGKHCGFGGQTLVPNPNVTHNTSLERTVEHREACCRIGGLLTSRSSWSAAQLKR